MKIRPVAAVSLILLSTAGCGQKGPLYLPGDPNEGRIEIPSDEQQEGADEDEQNGQSQQQ